MDHSAPHELSVVVPYRLDLTVSALRRLSSNLVDVYTADGRYLRACNDDGILTVTCVTQPHDAALAVRVEGGTDPQRALARVRRMLGTDRQLDLFYAQAGQISWLAPLAHRLRGIKPPRYPSLWEACVNAIVFQQISLHAASSIMHRLITTLGDHTTYEGIPLAVFPELERFLRTPDATLRAAGLSAGKLSTLQRVAHAIGADELDEERLQAESTAGAASILREIKGIGPWTAAVILLRGLGRLDAFPANDSGVAANLALVAGTPLNASAIADALGPQRGMLYFCLLLARLESRGDIGKPSDVSLL
jgi:DNA-3-methyladenine glycosylase II